jgi:hypothetical protein
MKIPKTKKVYIFFREEGFYPLELWGNDDARKNAEANPGTLKVEDTKGNTIWKLKTDKSNQ